MSHEWIYQHIYADKRIEGDLHKHLRCQEKRRKRYGSRDRYGQIPNRTSIEDRPDNVEERQRIGNLGANTIIGKDRRSAIGTLVERKSRLALLHLRLEST